MLKAGAKADIEDVVDVLSDVSKEEIYKEISDTADSHHTYTDWSQIESPAPYGMNSIHGQVLDWKRFDTYQTVDFMKEEIKVLILFSIFSGERAGEALKNFMGQLLTMLAMKIPGSSVM